MEKTKEEFVRFVRHAMEDKQSNSFIELYQFLLGCFVRADTDMDGKVCMDDFGSLIDEAAALPRRYGFAPSRDDMYSSYVHCQTARTKMFIDMNVSKDGYITLEEWITFSLKHIMVKVKTLSKDYLGGTNVTKDEFITFIKKAVVKSAPEYRDLYFFLLKCFVDADKDRDGAVNAKEFDAMIEIAAAVPRRFGLAPSSKQMFRNDAERLAKRTEYFQSMDTNNDGTISFDEWLQYALHHIIGKIATLSNPIEKTKEEFVRFIRHAMEDHESNAFVELYQFLVGCFIRADTKMDGKVSMDEFGSLIDEAAALPRMYGFAPKSEDMYSTELQQRTARAKMFVDMDTKKENHITLEGWITFSLKHIMSKVITLPKDHLSGTNVTKQEFIIFIKKAVDQSTPEYRDLYFFLLKSFVDADKDCDGAVNPLEFDAMIEVAAAAPRRFGLAPATNQMFRNDAERIAKRTEYFKKMDTNNDGRISFDEWLNYAIKHIMGKVATLR